MTKPSPTIRDGRKPGWFYIDDAVIDHHGAAIGAIGVAVYAALARHVNAHGQTAISYKRIAESLHIARNTVITALRNLAERDLITIEPQTDASGNPIAANLYTLCVIPDKGQETRRGGVPTGERGVPTDASPHAPDASPVPTGERGVPTDAYEGLMIHVGDDDGDRAHEEKTNPGFVRQLCARRAQGVPMNQKSAKNIAALVARGLSDERTVLQSLDTMIDGGMGMGGIVGLLNNETTIPPKGKPYEHTPTGNTNGTGGARRGSQAADARAADNRAPADRGPLRDRLDY